jgi:16S rRNA processing protein RimM
MSRSPADPASWRPREIVVGRVGRPHGLDGSLYLEGHGGVVPLEPGTPVRLGDRPAVIEARRGTAERPILRFDCAHDREQAAALRGRPVSVSGDRLPPVGGDEYFHVDLIGCRVEAGGQPLGEVRDVLAYPANDVLDVRDGDRQVLIPFAADVVLEVDVGGRLIRIREHFL